MKSIHHEGFLKAFAFPVKLKRFWSKNNKAVVGYNKLQ